MYMNISLGGGFKYFCFHPIGEDFHFDEYLSDGVETWKPTTGSNVLCIRQ